MGKIVEKTKKKKGRPSLLDLQKRKQLEEKKQQNSKLRRQKQNSISHIKTPIQHTTPNPKSHSNRRSTRRNPTTTDANLVTKYSEEDEEDDEENDEEDEDDEDEDDENKTKREKKLNLVLQSTPPSKNKKSSVNSPDLQFNPYAYNSDDDDENGETPFKKRKINAADHHNSSEKEEKPNPTLKAKETFSGTILESGSTTPLPEQALLVFILDRLQKKDTYGVYAEPVDLDELPDYLEIVDEPMDFGTVRKKLSSGAYSCLEQFEKDVFLICSNAMQYNSSDTVYFRQARSIQELAKKTFENLRQDSDDNEPEQKVVRRGRPPLKNLKKQFIKLSSERAGSEFSDTTAVPGRDNSTWFNSYDLRKGPLPDNSSLDDGSGRVSHSTRNNEAHINFAAEQKTDWNEEFPDYTLKGLSMKFGKKHFVLDENRRNTYKNSYSAAGGNELSLFATFDGEKRHLMAVGIHTEHGFSRSLARFAANLGPVVWKVASKKIEKSLPGGIKFGPGWVGENDTPPKQAPLLVPSSQSLPLQSPICQSTNSSPCTRTVGATGERSLLKPEPSGNSSSDVLPNRTFASSSSDGGLNLINSGSGGMRPNPQFQIHQSAGFKHPINGVNGAHGFNLTACQMNKMIRPTRSQQITTEAPTNSQTEDSVSRSSSHFVQSIPATTHLEKTSGTIDSSRCIQRLPSMHKKTESVPPDLNVRFQSPGSPSPGVRVDSPQPDLALQL
ncbi:bromodomain-containing protein 9-like [Papaver somniferum]|uniref:bromodomain-containing protein 9-like n=1 Tax=Papaver somniferum TaxID=3469 RepID=UPI000E705826|nr:bromodomain-containing protein 9-like [Papaver somniferum]